MSYTINPQPQQDSIEAYLKEKYPHIPVLPDGLPDDDSTTIRRYKNGEIMPFILLWFGMPKRTGKGSSFGNYKLDSRKASVDVVVVARNAREAREVINDVSDQLIGFKTDGGGRVTESDALWGQARTIDIQNRPSRWAATNRFDFGISARKTTPEP